MGPGKESGEPAEARRQLDEASPLFQSGIDYLEIFDEEHSVDEDRFIAIGPIRRGLVLIVWTEPGPAIALLRIAARHPRIIRENLESAA